MKVKYLAAPLIFIFLLLGYFQSATVASATGQACCSTGFSTGLSGGGSIDPAKCCNLATNSCISTSCDPTDVCNSTSNICEAPTAANTPTPCATDQECNLLPVTVTGCVSAGPGASYCGSLGNPLNRTPVTPVPNVQVQNLKCSINGGTDNGINTAVGCIEYDFSTGGFLKSLLTLAVGIGGGISLLLMLYGTFIVTTSAGIPDKLNQGKEIITSAATGLIFIILSIVLMNLIGVSILGLPGL